MTKLYTIYNKLTDIVEKEFEDNAPDHPELHTFPKHFHNGSNKDVKENELDEDSEKAIRDVLGFIRSKLAEYK